METNYKELYEMERQERYAHQKNAAEILGFNEKLIEQNKMLRKRIEELERENGLTMRAVDVANAFCNCVDPHFDLVELCSDCGKSPRH